MGLTQQKPTQKGISRQLMRRPVIAANLVPAILNKHDLSYQKTGRKLVAYTDH